MNLTPLSSGSASTKVVNSELTAKNEGFMMNVANKITASYDQNRFNEISATLSGDSGETSGLKYLTYLKNNKDNVFYNPVTEVQKDWGDATRGLTDAGMGLVVVGIVVISIVTAGAAAPAGAAAAGGTAAGAGAGAAAGATAATTTAVTATAAGAGAGVAAGTTAVTVGSTFSWAAVGSAALTAAQTTALTTASISGINASMNADGDLFKQAKSIGKTTLEDTISEESLKNIVISGLAAGAGSLGTQYFNLGTTTTINSSLTQRAGNALGKAAINTASTSAAQSIVNGDSLTDSLKNQMTNIVISAVGEVAANEIGNLAHPTDQFGNPTLPKISTTEQLALHAALGCTMAAAGGNNCASGAAAGVIGESFAEYLGKNTTLTNQQIIASSQLSGALTSAMVVGSDDMNSVVAGGDIARNAAENNYILGKVINQKAEEKLDKILTDIKGKSLDQVADQYVASKDPLEKAALFTILSAGYVSLPASTTELELMMATAGLSRAFAPQIGAALNRVDESFSTWTGNLMGKSPNTTTSLTSGLVKPDYYVGENGVAIPATGYRAIGGPSVERAISGDLMSREPITYFTFDDISKMSPAEAKSFLQLDQLPTHYGSFDTLHQFDSIKIPKTNWNEGTNLEPITRSYSEHGTGGATQVITTKPIENFTLKPLDNKQ